MFRRGPITHNHNIGGDNQLLDILRQSTSKTSSYFQRLLLYNLIMVQPFVGVEDMTLVSYVQLEL